MKALTTDDFGGIDHLHLTDIEVPQPGPDEVLIKVEYSSVNPVDWKICEGLFEGKIPHGFPLIPGWDASGAIEKVGSNVSQFSEGDEVYAYCRKPTIQWGTYAEYVCFDAQNVAMKPKSLTFAQAATIPLVGLTSWQALIDVGQLKSGETILIHAGAGGVGSFAIQLAKQIGAIVYTTCSANNHDYVKHLGADVAIDYKQESFVKRLKELEPEGVDVVYECVGDKTLEGSVEVLKREGRLVSIVSKPDIPQATEKNIKTGYVFVRPSGEQLQKIGELIDEGKIVPPHIEEMTLDDAKEALLKNKTGHTRGKLALKIG